MKVYVSKRPKSCKECQFCDKDNGLCEMLGQYFRDGYDYTDCPLQSLAGYTKQVRKEVCEEIRERLNQIINSIKYNPSFYDNEYRKSLEQKAVYKNIFKILDQIQGETK